MISLGRVSKNLVEPSTEVTVIWGGFSTEPQCKIRAKVVRLPFIKQNRAADLSAGPTGNRPEADPGPRSP